MNHYKHIDYFSDMDYVWKFLSAMVLIEIPLLLYFYVVKTNNSTTMKSFEKIKVEERERILFDNQTKNSTIFQPTSFITITKTTILANVKKAWPVTKTEKSKHLLAHAMSPKTSKEMRTKGTNYSQSNVKYTKNKKVNIPAGNKSYITSCTFSFDDTSLLQAREKLSKPFYLFYIHIDTGDFKYLSDNDRDTLLHWQYVLKEEKFLVQLPVDVDFLTFKLLVLDKEETTISIKLLSNKSNCFQKDYSDTLRSIKFLLWNKLFLNNTNYFLCNRYYEGAIGRNILYYVTTIWVGYDLTCSEMSSTQEFVQDIKFEKGCTPVITSIFCYLLSLQCVWVFVLLDIPKNSNGSKHEQNYQMKKAKDSRSKLDAKIHTIDETCDTDTVINSQLAQTDTTDTDNCENAIEVSPEAQRKNQKYKKNPDMQKGSRSDKTKLNPELIEIHEEKNSKTDQTYAKRNVKQESPKSQNLHRETLNKPPEPPEHPEHIESSKSETHLKESQRMQDNDNEKRNTSVEEPTSATSLKCCPEFLHSGEKPCYKRNDRPYGLRRFVTKLLYTKCCFCRECCLHNPVMRLQFLIWVSVLLPFGFYRTFGRYCLLKLTYEDYFNVARPSEPFLSCLSRDCIVTFDIIYATCFPVIYIFLVHNLLNVFLKSETRICCNVSVDESQKLIINNEKLCDRFLFSYIQFSRALGTCCQKDCCENKDSCRRCCKQCCCNNCGECCCNYCEKCCCNYCEDCCCNKSKECNDNNCEKCKENCNTCCNLFKMCCISKSCSSVCIGLCSCFYCTFPCIPFHCKFTEACLKNYTCCKTNSENNLVLILIIGFYLIVMLLLLLLFYIFCLRPMFSTFTFLLRSFTYIVFVLFPNRPFFMRIAIMFVTAFIYFSNYIHELINMNAAILSFIFELEEEKQLSLSEETILGDNRDIKENAYYDNRKDKIEAEEKCKVENIDEEKFESIYQNLSFTRRKFYTLYLKILVVIIYLFITFETFITNTKSLTGSNFKDILQFLLILIGPYAIVYFLKANDSDFLTEENKTEIRNAFKSYRCEAYDVEGLSTKSHSDESSFTSKYSSSERIPLVDKSKTGKKTCSYTVEV